MTRLSKLRSKLFASKLTSSINDNVEGSDRINDLLTQARLGYDTMLSQTNGEKIDQRRSASRGQIIYRQGVVAPASLVLMLDITINRQYHKKLLQQLNQIINHTIIGCEQLGLECIILYPDQGQTKEYLCEGLDQTIDFLNTIIEGVGKTDALLPKGLAIASATSLQQCYNEHYDKHIIILSDRLSWESKQDSGQMKHLLDTHQAIGYIREYPSPVIKRGALPQGLIKLKR